jgi:hypothetical protein
VRSGGISLKKRLAEDRAPAGEGQVEVAHRARDPDVAEAALLLERALVERTRVREDALLAADHEDDRVLEALGVVQRHEGHEPLVVAARVGVGHERDLLQEEVERVVLGAGVELARDLDELLEVLDAPLRLDRPLGLERVEVAGLVQHGVEQIADRHLLLGALAQEGHRRHEALEGPHRRRAEPGHRARVGRRLPHRHAHRLRVLEHARERRLPDPALGRVGHAREGDDVLWVLQHGQVGDRVLDLGALVELRPADDLVADLAPHERVLEHPRLRVGPVEDRELRARDALVDQPLDLAHHEPRLGVLVLELAHLDRVALTQIGPQRLAHPPAVVRDDRVGDAEDRLRRAVVLLEAHDLGVRVVVAEIEDVGDVRAAEAVDRVVGHEPGRDEVVGALDVEVVDGPVELDALHRLDDVVAAVFGEHRHPRADRGGGHERQRALHPVGRRPQARRVAHGHVGVLADAIGVAGRRLEVLEAGLDLPAAPAGVAHRDAACLERAPDVRVAPAHRHAMHRRAPAPIAAERDREVAAPTLVAVAPARDEGDRR